MTIDDKIAKALIRKHAKVLNGSGWFCEAEDFNTDDVELVEYQTAKLRIADVDITCQIADTPELQVQGLNWHKELGAYEGMIFPYWENGGRRVSFHMDRVKFPIDLIFVGSDSRVTKIVENVEPGTPGQWGMPHISAVIEVNGGFCAAHNISVGSEVAQFETKTAQLATCPECGSADIGPDPRFCQQCGARQFNGPAPTRQPPTLEQEQEVSWDAIREDRVGPETYLMQDAALDIIKKLINVNRAGDREAVGKMIESPAGKFLIEHGLVEIKESKVPNYGGVRPVILRPPLPFLTDLGRQFAYGLGRARGQASPKNVKGPRKNEFNYEVDPTKFPKLKGGIDDDLNILELEVRVAEITAQNYLRQTNPDHYTVNNPSKYVKKYIDNLSDMEKSNFGIATGVLIKAKGDKLDYNVRTGEFVYIHPNSSAMVVLSANGTGLLVKDLSTGSDIQLDPTTQDVRLSKTHKRISQEVFPSYTRKDFNPKMVTPNDTPGRFRDRDTPDEVLNTQPMDQSHFEQEIGYDQGTSDEMAGPMDPAVRPL